MKKYINMKMIGAMLLGLVSVLASAQNKLPVVKDLKKLDVVGHHLSFVGDNELLYTTSHYQGLKKINLSTGEMVVLSEKRGAGYQPILMDKDVVVKETGVAGFSKINLKSGEATLVTSNQMDKLKLDRMSGSRTSRVVMDVAASDDLSTIELRYSDGSVSTIAPKGEGDYISISLSPDRSKVLFRVSGLGSYVSNLDGNIVASLGNVEFPHWLNDNQVVYAITKDDGHQFLSSRLFVSDLSGRSAALMKDDAQIALYPSVNSKGDRIIFNTPKGEVFMLLLN